MPFERELLAEAAAYDPPNDCAHEHIVPVSRPPLGKDTDLEDRTRWRCVDCGDVVPINDDKGEPS